MKTGLLKSRKLAGGLGLLLALVLTLSAGVPAAASLIPPIPYYGYVTVCGTPVPEGTLVEAKINDVTVESDATNADGSYYVEVPGEDGDTVEFWVMEQMVFSTTWEMGPAINQDLEVRPKLTVAAGTGGSVTEPGEGTFGPYDCGDVVDLVAAANAGYEFDGWTGDVGTIDDVGAASTTIEMDGFYSITANFVSTCTHTLTTIARAGGSISEPGEGTFPEACDAEVDLLAVPDECYEFVNWTGNTGTITDVGNAETTIVMSGDYTVTANFQLKEFNLTVASGGNGSVTEPGEGIFPENCGTVVDLLAVPDSGYVFLNWTGDTGTIGSTSAADTTIDMQDNYSITANFVEEGAVCTLTTIAGAGGSVTEPGEGSFSGDCLRQVDLLAVPDECYEFTGWTGDTDDIGNPDVADTYIIVDGDDTVIANFQLKQFNLTVASGGNGSVTEPGEGIFPEDCGAVVDLLAVPDSGYVFLNWTGDTGTIGSTSAADTTIDMQDNYSITANFVPEGCTLTTMAGAGGSISEPATSPLDVECGAQVDLLAVPDECYEFVNWTGDTGGIFDVDAADTYIIVNGHDTITANFTLKQFYLTLSSTTGGSVSNPGEGILGPYDCGTVVNIEATAVGCYNFVNWTGDTGTVAAVEAASTTITMNGNYSVMANFELAGALQQIEIPFNEGWNTFSTPISLHDCVNTWDEFIAANNLDVLMIYGYDAGEDAWVTVNGDDVIQPLWGYYVKTAQAGAAYIIPNGQATPVPIRDIISGVSLIGIAPQSLGDQLLTSALVTIYEAPGGLTGYTLVVSPNQNPDIWAYARGDASPPTMKVGRAYWLVMLNAGEYVGSSNTPLP